MSTKQIHYNIDPIRKKFPDANIYLIVGEKSNGKSFQVKNKIGIDEYNQFQSRFALVRRWETDMTNNWVEQYFSDVDIQSKTDNKYVGITTSKGAIWYSILDEKTGKLKPKEKIGYRMPLSMEQHFSSGSYLDINNIIFEEFMERGSYIKNEPDKLMALYSTIDRKRRND